MLTYMLGLKDAAQLTEGSLIGINFLGWADARSPTNLRSKQRMRGQSLSIFLGLNSPTQPTVGLLS